MLTMNQNELKLVELQREINECRLRIQQAEKFIDYARNKVHDAQELIFDIQDSRR
jgi:hypothetical protein